MNRCCAKCKTPYGCANVPCACHVAFLAEQRGRERARMIAGAFREMSSQSTTRRRVNR